MEWVKRSRPLIGRGRMRYGTRENEKCMRVFVGTGTWVRGYVDHGGRAWRWRMGALRWAHIGRAKTLRRREGVGRVR